MQLAVQVILHTFFALAIIMVAPMRNRFANFKYLASETVRAFAIFLAALQTHASGDSVNGVAGLSVSPPWFQSALGRTLFCRR